MDGFDFYLYDLDLLGLRKIHIPLSSDLTPYSNRHIYPSNMDDIVIPISLLYLFTRSLDNSLFTLWFLRCISYDQEHLEFLFGLMYLFDETLSPKHTKNFLYFGLDLRLYSMNFL